uniref:BPTI/Kunitz inhibitor domain-containing protein n=1 Tax=Anolis carolinensis TaxID=28377 RepID=A0A803TFV7_ANOCA
MSGSQKRFPTPCKRPCLWVCEVEKEQPKQGQSRGVFEDGPPCPTSCSVSFSFLLLDICLFPPEEGHCRGNMPRFFFNSTSRRCEKFIYGGCSGNGNNFETREECHQVCSRRGEGQKATG